MSKGTRMVRGIVLGDACVGKTAVINQFVNREFSGHYKATIGSDFISKQMELDDGFVTLQIWDTAGQERYRSLGSSFYRHADCCIIVYDISNHHSFDSILSWIDDFTPYIEGEKNDFPFLLLGNKSDLDAREVSYDEGKAISEQNNMMFFEVSAKTSENINNGFQAVAQLAIERKLSNASKTVVLPNKSSSIEIVKKEEKTNGCC